MTGAPTTGPDASGHRHQATGAFAAAGFDALPDAVAVLEASGRIVAVNATWSRLSAANGGQPETTGIGVSYLEVCARSAAAGCSEAAAAATGLAGVLAGRLGHFELEYPCPSPEAERWFLLRLDRLAGEAGGAVASHVDISRRHEDEAALAHQASHDALTGLANRALVERRLEDALSAGTANGTGRVGVVFVDLDGFKAVNDAHGHETGDALLRLSARRLAQCVAPGHTLGRLGGDEFVAIAPAIDQVGLDRLARRLADALEQPFSIGGRQLFLQASAGSYLAEDGALPSDCLRRADRAMYAAKRSRAARAGGSP